MPSESLGKTEVEALDESEKLVEKYMEYAAQETKVTKAQTLIAQLMVLNMKCIARTSYQCDSCI